MTQRRWALFLSGRGSTAQSALDLCSQVDIRLVVSSKPTAAGLLRAKRSGVSTLLLDKNVNWSQLTLDLKSRGITHIFLLGFMKLLPQQFCQEWQGRIWNIHPSLLPAYPGLHAIENSYKDQAPMGVTIHEVIPEMDAGPIVYQKKVYQSDRNHRLDFSEIQLLMSATERRLIGELVIQKERGVSC
ncbi:MAG: phosphoribosylglycinamide formyltransferase [Oligoflexia bacterium]|nr:MAG: phosphoribosylglycinamide formyltransferase [Oligoflexia bacterium]